MSEELEIQIMEAVVECNRLRGLAHEALFAEWSKDHRGHSAIVNHTNAWATRGNEWIAACEKRDALIAKRNHPTTMDNKELSERKRAEVDIWDGMLKQKAREYVAQGMPHEAAEERACNDIRREIIASK